MDRKATSIEFSDYPICPWCEAINTNEDDSTESGYIEKGEYVCNNCGKSFYVSVNTKITYSTFRVEEEE
jgi:transposase-like protein